RFSPVVPFESNPQSQLDAERDRPRRVLLLALESPDLRPHVTLWQLVRQRTVREGESREAPPEQRSRREITAKSVLCRAPDNYDPPSRSRRSSRPERPLSRQAGTGHRLARPPQC